MIKRTSRTLFLIIIPFLMICGNSPESQHDSFDATLWLQTSAEYRALCHQALNSARNNLIEALHDPQWSAEPSQKNGFSKLPPAIIVDVDQTLLDNSPYKASMIKRGMNFDAKMWDDWLYSARLPVLSGALNFVKFADSCGIHIFYITNRSLAFKKATAENLKYHGFPVDSSLDVILTKDDSKGWTDDKSSRRNFIAQNYRILLIIGDDLNDFLPALLSSEKRIQLAGDYKHYWGEKWILLPNPLYGSWEESLYQFNSHLSKKERRMEKFQELTPMPGVK